MQTDIQRQYDEVIASRYDFDPQGLIGIALDRAAELVRGQLRCGPDEAPLNVLDLGIGTGLYLEKLRSQPGLRFQPYGLDISRKMIDVAKTRLTDLIAEVDDAANLGEYFTDVSFDLVGTHFITGFVPLDVLTPQVYRKLSPGGLWSVMGATREGFPELQRKVQTPLMQLLFGKLDVGRQVCVPANHEEVARNLEEHGFKVRSSETFTPAVSFRNFAEFMEFAYYGGWLAPFVEAVGLHKAGRMMKFFMDSFFFPVQDHHTIFLVLGEKC
ncbi:MAG: class I SAM-dependent methyltransferase [Gemmataceae bacterium]